MGYTHTALKGFSWMSGFRLFNRALTFIKIAILARVLSPTEFGVFGIASLTLALLEMLTETGINIILIQTKDKIEEYIDSAWVVSIIRGLLIFIVLFLSAPFVANFFNTPQAINVLYIISLSPLIKGFINPAEIRFQKELRFNYEFFFRTSIFLVDAVVSILLALYTKSVYSLVFGLISASILEVILSFVLIKPTPKFNFKFDYIKNIFNKGKWITGSVIFNYFSENGDNIVVGRLLGASTLGIYQMAYKISYIPISEFSDVVNRVVFPVYTHINEDRKRLLYAFYKTTALVSGISILIGAIIFLFPAQIVSLILGDKWVETIPLLSVLAFYGIIRASLGPASAMFFSLGKQSYVTLMVFARLFALLLSIYPLVVIYGLIGAAYSALISALVEIPFIIYFTYKIKKGI